MAMVQQPRSFQRGGEGLRGGEGPLRRGGGRIYLPEALGEAEQGQLPLFLAELPAGSESPRRKGVSGAGLLHLTGEIPFTALVFLTGDAFLDTKLILSQFFR